MAGSKARFTRASLAERYGVDRKAVPLYRRALRVHVAGSFDMNAGPRYSDESGTFLLETSRLARRRRAVVEELWNHRLAWPPAQLHHVYQGTFYTSLHDLDVARSAFRESHVPLREALGTEIQMLLGFDLDSGKWCGRMPAPPPLPDSFVYKVLFESGLPWQESVLALGYIPFQYGLSGDATDRLTRFRETSWRKAPRAAPAGTPEQSRGRSLKNSSLVDTAQPVIAPLRLSAVLLEQAVTFLMTSVSGASLEDPDTIVVRERTSAVLCGDVQVASQDESTPSSIPTLKPHHEFSDRVQQQTHRAEPATDMAVGENRSRRTTPACVRSMNVCTGEAHATAPSRITSPTRPDRYQAAFGHRAKTGRLAASSHASAADAAASASTNTAPAGTGQCEQNDLAQRERHFVLGRHIARLPSMLARCLLIRLIATNQLTLPLLRLFQGLELPILSLRSCRMHITDTWMPLIGTFVGLEELDLSFCHRITDQGIRFLARRYGSEENTEEPSVASRTLRSLSLQGCNQLTNTAVLHLEAFPRLKRLDVSDCPNMGNAALQVLAERFRLRALSVARCERVGSSSIAALLRGENHNRMASSKSVQLDQKAPIEEVPLETNECQLEFLDVSGCPAVGEYAFLGSTTRFSNRIAANAASPSTGLPLRTLRLRGCTRVNDTVCEQIGHLFRNLQELDLYGCARVTDRGILDLVRSLEESLQVLCLAETQITDTGLAALAQLRCLRSLHLTRCRRLEFAPGVMEMFCTRMAAQASLSELRLRSLPSVNARVIAELSGLFVAGELKHLNLTDCHQVNDEALLALGEALRVRLMDATPRTSSRMGNSSAVATQRPPRCLVQSLSLRNTGIRDTGLIFKVFIGMRHLDLGECPTLEKLDTLFGDIAEAEEALARFGRRSMRLERPAVPIANRTSAPAFSAYEGIVSGTCSRACRDSHDDVADWRGRTNTNTEDAGCWAPWGLANARASQEAGLSHGPSALPVVPPWLNTLEYLDLSHCQSVSFANLRTLRSESLRILILDHCSGVTNACVALLAYHVPNLQELSLRFTAVGDLGIAAFANRFRHLEKLHLRGLPDVTHVGIRRLAASPLATKLRVLELAECPAIGELALASLNGMKALEYLSLKGCTEINDAALRQLEDVPVLTVLNLRQCPLVSSKQIELLRSRLPSLVEVKFSNESRGLAEHTGTPSALVDSFLAYVHGGSRRSPTGRNQALARQQQVDEAAPSPTRIFLDMFDAWEMGQRSARRRCSRSSSSANR